MNIKEKAEQYKKLDLSGDGKINANTLDTLYPAKEFESFEVNGHKLTVERISLSKSVVLKRIAAIYYSKEADEKLNQIISDMTEFIDKDEKWVMDNFEETDIIRFIKFLNDKKTASINQYLKILGIKTDEKKTTEMAT